MDKNREVQIPYNLLGSSILFFVSLGLVFITLTLFKVSLSLVWWIVLFLVVTAILFGSNWYLGLAMWFAMKLRRLGNR
jgi:hypothetical protein